MLRKQKKRKQLSSIDKGSSYKQKEEITVKKVGKEEAVTPVKQEGKEKKAVNQEGMEKRSLAV